MCEYFEKNMPRALIYQAYGWIKNGDYVRIQGDGRIQFINYQALHESAVGELDIQNANVREENGAITAKDFAEGFTGLEIKRQANAKSSPTYPDLYFYLGKGTGSKESGTRIGYTCYTVGRSNG